jgi:hypothetical protein
MAKSTRLTRRTTTQQVEVGDAAVVEEKKSEGFEAGIAILTAVILIVAILVLDHELGPLNSGIFFGK